MRLLWEYESGVLADVRALRKTVTRRGDVRGAGSTPPGRAGCPAGNVPEVPQIVSRRKQVLRVLRHTFAGCTPPGGASARADPAARGAPSARRTASSAETCCSPPATRGPACGASSTASGGSADAACGEARSASAAASCSAEARGSAARAARSAGCQAAFTPTASSSPCTLTGRDRGF